MLKYFYYLLFISVFCISSSIYSQQSKVKYVEFIPKKVYFDQNNNLIVKIYAKIKDSFKMYAYRLPQTGPSLPSPISFTTSSTTNLKSIPKIIKVQESSPILEYDSSLDIKTKVFYKNATFKLTMKSEKYQDDKKTFLLNISYTLCTKRYCLPPKTQMIPITFQS